MSKRSVTLALGLCLSLLAFGGCGDDPGGTGSVSPLADNDGAAPAASESVRGDGGVAACDPLAPRPKAIRRGHVIAVGQGSDGTLYLVSAMGATEAPDLVFVSSGNMLVRKRVLGSGSSGGADADFTVSYEDGSAPNRLVVKRRANAITGIALVHDQDKSFYDDLPSSAVQLEPVQATRLDGLTLVNLPGEILLEFAAHAVDGTELVVTRPRDDWSYDDFRVYYGHNGALREAAVPPGNVSPRSSTVINFTLDGASYTAKFASSLSGQGASAALVTPSGELPLTLDDATHGLPSGESFTCFQ